MHPFYDPSRGLLSGKDPQLLGLASMVAYLLFWTAAIPFALRILTRILAQSAARPAPDRAETIVRERYAAGEIDDAELRRRLHVLRS